MIWRIHKASSQCSSYSGFISTYCPEKHQSVARVCRLRWSHLNTRQFWEIHFRPTSGKIICSKELNLLKRRISGSAGEIGLSKNGKVNSLSQLIGGPLLAHPKNRRNVRGDQFIDKKGELRPACIPGLTIFSKPISRCIPGITSFSKLISSYNPCNLANPRMLYGDRFAPEREKLLSRDILGISCIIKDGLISQFHDSSRFFTF